MILDWLNDAVDSGKRRNCENRQGNGSLWLVLAEFHT